MPDRELSSSLMSESAMVARVHLAVSEDASLQAHKLETFRSSIGWVGRNNKQHLT